ncbi:MAG: hypothetical protein JF612_14960 [Planctomycetia bacterium]|nr:hypothetical protein [Planctomycetia bacterium]
MHQRDFILLPDRLHPLRHARHAVAFAKAGPFVGHRAVVVESGAPQHAAVSHHALFDFQHFAGVARTAGNVSDAEITRIHKADEIGTFMIEQRVRADRIA